MKANRKVKVSVFCSILSNKKYALQAYLDLHPGSDITEEDIEIITIENVLVNDFYNDFGMMVKGRNLILIEAQSTWSYNILYRALIYYVKEIIAKFDQEEINLYARKQLPFYEPEVYVVYSGKENIPDFISFEKDFKQGEHSALNLEIKIIQDMDESSFFGKYFYFCRSLEEALKSYSNRIEAIQHTIEKCIKNNIFAEYFVEHQGEVIDMLDLLFDEERANKLQRKEDYEEAKAIGQTIGEAIGEVIGEAKGEAKGEKNMQKKIALNMKQEGLSIELISQTTGLTKEEIEEL